MRGPSVLVGFDLRFTNKDHHIRELGVWTPDDGRIQVFFGDKKPSDDSFVWTVQWVVLGRDRGLGIERPVSAAMLDASMIADEDHSHEERGAGNSQSERPDPGAARSSLAAPWPEERP
jgi:hypothetical protein